MAEAIRRLFGEIFFRDKATKSLDKLNDGMDQAKESAVGLNGLLAALGGAAVLSVFKNLAGTAIKTAAAFEQTAISFEVMLGSAEEAQKLLTQIEDFSLVTPFTPKALEENAKTMLNFGLAADSIMPSLQMLGDISGGNVDKLNRLTLAFSQVSSQGRLMGQDLLQMINAGFNPLLFLSEKTGKSMATLKKEMSAGKIAFEDVAEAMAIATGEGGKFNNMMEKQSKTWNGLMSTMEGFKGQIFKQIGQIFIKWFKPILEWIVKITQALVQFFKTERGFAIMEIAIIALSVAVGIILVAAFKAAAIAAWVFVAPLLILFAKILLVVAIITVLILIIEDLYVALTGGESVLKDIYNWFVKMDAILAKKLTKAIDWVISKFWKFINTIKSIGLDIANFFMEPINAVIDLFNRFVDFISGIPGRVIGFFKSLGTAIFNFFEGLLPDWAIRILNRVSSTESGPAAVAAEGRAAGGPVTANTPFVVGEDGPELFVPGRDGTIIPNGGKMGGIGSTISIKSIVGTLNIVVQGATEAASEIENVVLDALNNLSEGVLAAELGIEIS